MKTLQKAKKIKRCSYSLHEDVVINQRTLMFSKSYRFRLSFTWSDAPKFITLNILSKYQVPSLNHCPCHCFNFLLSL